MARIRTIKPDFFTSEDIVELEPMARLLYIALWCEADREGRMAWKPRTFKMRYLPGDDCDIDALCDALVTRGLVCLYGDGLAYIPSFGAHQHVNPREASSALPDPNDEKPRVTDASARVHQSSVTGREERKGKERKEDISTGADAPRRDDDFEEFWESYPRRDGANPKEPAAKLFRAAVRAGSDPARIIAGAKRCAVVEVGKIGTPYIPQAVKWLRDKRWNDYLAEAVTAEKAREALGSMFYAKPESPQLDAWDRYYQSVQGKSAPRDRNGGWYFKTEWPLGHEPADAPTLSSVAVPQLRSMGH